MSLNDPFLVEYERLTADVVQWFRARASYDGTVPHLLESDRLVVT